ncbi:MAG: Lrp/AsnC family transcriptional regulator [Sedimentisphaerales bacterium]|nr:Lrp/AsnC family transcriptional regulator [Sedimentisphaerales bacterium]
MELDQTDWQIIEILCEKHLPNSTIAEQLGISEGTVRQRVKKLKDSNALKICAMRNPNVLANQQLVFVTANLIEAKLLDVKAKEISQLENVLSVSAVSGQYDLLIEVLVDSNRGLVTFLTEQLASVEGIAKTESFVVLQSYNKFV